MSLVGCGARFKSYGPPRSVVTLGAQQFMRYMCVMVGEYREEEDNLALKARQRGLQAQVGALTLTSK